MPEIPLLTVEGDAYTCGLAHGRRFAREIAENIETYLSRFAAAGLAHDQAFAQAERWHKAIAAEIPAGAAGPDGCTTFGLLSQATADSHCWLGQNWEGLAGVHGRTFVLRAQRKGKPRLVCLTEAGIAGGKMGVNECGIGLVENGLASSHDGRNPYRKPFHVRCREVLEAETFADASRPVADTPRTCSATPPRLSGQAARLTV